ncbi:MAG TPA: DUF2179 domain-containing protein [Oceanithermus sp.]|nr:DUF2179 domain-containing protein [Oceanithermus sp.]
MDTLLGALVIFLLRLVDVPLSTVRVVMMVRGQRRVAAVLAFFESLVWILAISQVFARLDSPLNMLAFAAGFASGTALGMTLEAWFAPGQVLIRAIVREGAEALVAELRERGYGVTVVRGEGRAGEVPILFIVGPRRRAEEVLGVIRAHAPRAFVTVEGVQRAIGGHVPAAGFWPIVRR